MPEHSAPFGSSIGIRTLTDMILSHMPLPIGLWSHVALRENYDISTLGLTDQCSASELPKHIMVIPAGIEPTFQA